MTRFQLAPIVGLVLAVASCLGTVVFQARLEHSSKAQLTLARTQNTLNQLQGIPWQVQNPRFGSPATIRAMMGQEERTIDASIGRLSRTSPTPALEALKGPVKANFASLDRIYAMGLAPGGWNDPGPTNDVSQAENVSLQHAGAAIGAANSVYAHRASVSRWLAIVGSIGTILALLAAFFFYYSRSRRIARAQHATLEAEQLANEQLGETLALLAKSKEDRELLLQRTVEVAEHERIRLAMDLHDGPIQKLTVLAFNIDRLSRRLERVELDQARVLMTEVRTALSEEMDALRRLMVELRPPILNEGGLAAALTDTARSVFVHTPIQWTIECTIEKNSLIEELETGLYRVVSEALTNVRKHSQCTHVGVTLVPTSDMVHLTIKDDGVGFDLATPETLSNGGHYGLRGIRERVSGLSGTCRIDSTPGGGTLIEVFLPLRTRKEEGRTDELATA